MCLCGSHGLAPPDRADADQTGQGSRLEHVAHELSGPDQTGDITTCRRQTPAVTFHLRLGSSAEGRCGVCGRVTCLPGVGREGRLEDLASLPVLVLGASVILILIRGGRADVDLCQSLNSSLVGPPDLLKPGLACQSHTTS